MRRSRRLATAALAVLTAAFAARAQNAPPDSPAPATPRSPVLRPPPAGTTAPAARPKPQATIFDPSVNAKEAIDAAIRRAAPERRRVLVFWGFNASRWAMNLQNQLAVPDTARMIRNDYEVVAAEVGDSGFGAINLALARSYGADIKIERNMLPWLTVIEAAGEKAGQALLSRSTQGLEKPRSTRENGDYHALRVQDLLVEQRPPQPPAGEVVAAALTRAHDQSRPALVFFLDREDPWSTRLHTWLRRDDVRAVLDRHMVVVTVDMQRFPGAGEQFTRFGGEQSEVSPWYLLVDGQGRRLAPDAARGEKDYGFPTGDEIAPFLAMLGRVAPGLGGADGQTLRTTLEAMVTPPQAAPAKP